MIKKTFILFLLFLTTIYSKELIFGVVPQQSPEKLYASWQPFIEYLSKKTNTVILFKTEKSIPEFEKKLYNGEYDIAYSNPYHFVIANIKQNHQAIARFDKKIVGILVASKDSKINSIEDIKNKEFLFPAPMAFAATILTKYEILEKLNYDIEKSKKFKYVNSHDSVYKGIERNIGDVGGGIMRTYNKFDNKEKLKIIYKTNEYPSHPISISNKIDKKLVRLLQKELVNMPTKLTKPINSTNMIATDTNEYNDVKKLANSLNIIPSN